MEQQYIALTAQIAETETELATINENLSALQLAQQRAQQRLKELQQQEQQLQKGLIIQLNRL